MRYVVPIFLARPAYASDRHEGTGSHEAKPATQKGKQTMTSTTTNQKPKKSFRIGHTSVSIWKRIGPTGYEYYSTQFQRSYKTDSDARGYTDSFNHEDLLNVAELARRAEAWITEQQQA